MSALRSSHVACCSGRPMESAVLPWRRPALPQTAICRAVTKTETASGVHIDVEKTSWNSRRVFAAVSVATPVGSVWSALTDYDNLAKFIPSLVENRCLDRNGNSVVLYQVGAQDVAMGVKFSAAVTLRCTEFIDGGLPDSLMTPPPPGSSSYGNGSAGSGSSGDWSGGGDAAGPASLETLFPYPATSAPGVRSSDISFELLEGDFQCFRGVWRMQQVGELTTLLSYALYVKPQAWLPVALIQGRIENEVVRNLEAVSRYAELQYAQGGHQ